MNMSDIKLYCHALDTYIHYIKHSMLKTIICNGLGYEARENSYLLVYMSSCASKITSFNKNQILKKGK